MTRRAPDSMVSDNSHHYHNNISICSVDIPMEKLWKQFGFTIVAVTPTGVVPFSVSHISESKISAHFPQWLSEQLDNTCFLILWSNSNNNWSILTDCSVVVLCLQHFALLFHNNRLYVLWGSSQCTEKRGFLNPEL